MGTARTTLAELQADPHNAALLAAGWLIVPCSCMCGGEWAWINPDSRMHGCVCHNTPNKSNDAIDALREALSKPTGEIDGNLRLENLDPALTEVTVTHKTIHAMRKLTRKRNAKGRRVMKIRYMKSQPRTRKDWSKTEFREVDCTHLVPPLPAIDCLTECEHIGACCKSFVLWVSGMPWPETQDAIEAQAGIDKRGLPFQVQAHGSTVYTDTNELTGKHVWYLTCKALMDDGLCGIYDNRPDLCKTFRPGADPLCIKHPDNEAARARFALGMGEPIV